MAALARVLFVVGGNATFQTALLAVRRGVANAFRGNGTGSGFAFSFTTGFFGHDVVFLRVGKSGRLSLLCAIHGFSSHG